MSEVNNPFFDGKVREKILDLNQENEAQGKKKGQADFDMEEAMQLYAEIADVFIKHNTRLDVSYMVLAAMADAVFTYHILGSDEA